MDESWGVAECGAFLRIERKFVLRLAASGELPAAKIGRSWIFNPADVRAYRDTMIQKQTQTRRQDQDFVLPEPKRLPGRGRAKAHPKLPDLTIIGQQGSRA